MNKSCSISINLESLIFELSKFERRTVRVEPTENLLSRIYWKTLSIGRLEADSKSCLKSVKRDRLNFERILEGSDLEGSNWKALTGRL